MSERFIIIPPPAKVIDPATKKTIQIRDENGEMSDHPDRSFDWFMHVHILTHLQFSMDVGGYDAVKAGKEIAKSMEKAMDAGEPYFAVTADQHRRLLCCIARAEDKHAGEGMKDKPNPKILAKSSHGMIRPLSTLYAYAFVDMLDAIANATTNKPVIPVVGDEASEPSQEAN